MGGVFSVFWTSAFIARGNAVDDQLYISLNILEILNGWVSLLFWIMLKINARCLALLLPWVDRQRQEQNSSQFKKELSLPLTLGCIRLRLRLIVGRLLKLFQANPRPQWAYTPFSLFGMLFMSTRFQHCSRSKRGRLIVLRIGY